MWWLLDSGSEHFFFEKKKQKTSANLARWRRTFEASDHALQMTTPKLKSPETRTFEEILTHTFQCLKPLGFKKVQRTFYRVPTPGIVQIVNLQKTGAFGPFTINFGVFIEYVRGTLHPDSEPIPANKVREGFCHVNPRIGQLCGRKDIWWDLWDLCPDKILNDIMPLLMNEGLDFLNKFKAIELAEQEAIRLGETRELGISGPSAATLAVIHRSQGNPRLAIKALTDLLAKRPGDNGVLRYTQSVAETLRLGSIDIDRNDRR